MSTIKNTEILNHHINQSSNIKEFLNENQKALKPILFHHFLHQLIEEKGIKNNAFFKQSNLSESYGYQLLNGNRKPSRDKVLQACIGLTTTVNNANQLLKLAEKSELYVRNKRDAILIFSLNNQMAILEVNALLYEEDCKTLSD